MPFRNVTVDGAPGEYPIQFAAADAERNVCDVTFEQVTINGHAPAGEPSRLRIDQHVEGMQFAPN